VRIEPLAPSSRAILRLLHHLPAPWGRRLLAAGALTQGLLRPSRRQRAHAWARHQLLAERGGWRLTLAVLAERGRFLADATQIGVPDPRTFRRRVILEGAERLAASTAREGTLLIGFHLGSAATALALEAAGQPVIFTGRGRGPLWPKAPARWIVPPAANLIQWTDTVSRTSALRRLQRRLRARGTVYMAVDGEGREAFAIPLPGRSLVVRAGWLALRRSTGARTLPVLAHREARGLVVRIHPPLPEPVADPEADVARCREHLTPIVTEFVRRFPAQCFMLALGHGDAP
jgi:lauroyl/myristoyl acyltransferase